MSLSSNVHFSKAPSVKISRSVFDRSHGYKTTWNNGSLIPIMWDLILPGDSVSIDLSSVVRMSTPIKPIMDNVVMDTFFFFVPLRLLDKYFEKVMGGLDSTDVWKPAVEHTVPQIEFPHNGSYTLSAECWYKIIDLSQDEFNDYKQHMFTDKDYIGKYIYERRNSSTPGKYAYVAVSSSSTYSASTVYCNRYSGWGPGSLADYLGLPIGASPIVDANSKVQSVMQYPFRAYCKVWNEFFRDQNYMLPCDDHFDDPTTIEGSNYRQGDWSSDADTDLPASYYDYITDTIKGAKPLRVSRFHDAFSSVLPQPQRGDATPIPSMGTVPVISSGDLKFNIGSSNIGKSPYINATGVTGFQNVGVNLSTALGSASALEYASGLSADLSQIVSPATINDLRTAFQLQKFSEIYAMSGTRYIEIIRGFFGVINPDYRLQRPEYLGGSRKYLNISQVLQTSSTDTTTPQGNTAAYSLTTDKEGVVRKSFTEHGILLGLVCCRTHRSYQSGFNRMWDIKRKYDFPWPQFSHLSNVPVYNKELFCYGDWINNGGTPKSIAVAYNNGVFGYQERYFEYRYFPDIVTSSFVSQGPTPLDFWHFADYYQKPVYASMDWLLEGPENLDRCLAVTSQEADQFIGDFYFKYIHTRPLPAYGVPGLADHF